jgi:hypothetical protein
LLREDVQVAIQRYDSGNYGLLAGYACPTSPLERLQLGCDLPAPR